MLERAIGILYDFGCINKDNALQLLQKTNGSVKLSLLIALSGLDVIEANQLLEKCHGNLRTALAKVKGNWFIFNLI